MKKCEDYTTCWNFWCEYNFMLSSQKRLITKFILKALLWGISRGLLVSFNLHPNNTSLLIFLALHTLEKPAIWHFSPERTNLIPRRKILQETKITTHEWWVWLLCWWLAQILPYDSLSTDKDSSSKVFGIMLLLGMFALTSASFSSFALIKELKKEHFDQLFWLCQGWKESWCLSGMFFVAIQLCRGKVDTTPLAYDAL